MELEVPERVAEERIRLEDLPPDWNRVPDHPACVRLGDAWARAGRPCLLRVPSAAVPVETNVLLNPLHAEPQLVRVIAVNPWVFDRRLVCRQL